MGCGNSSPTTNNNANSCNTGGRSEFSSKLSDESVTDDDRQRDYGGVYVGLPTDLSNIPEVQIGSLRDSESLVRDSSLRKPPWGDGL
ncbi:overexpressed in colon carcinoma 1 protein-like [Brachyistius frenatus]|uniref:overexpressed in colon carcinoma 1 protein-like n=1 Tax=Brachyistius frenatus TaxID=100188 RepID=UPI0037E80877